MAYMAQRQIGSGESVYSLGTRSRGFGSYDKTGDWEWMYYPPPYDFLAPADSVAVPAPILYTPSRGLSGCGCGGTCGGCGDDHSHGLGLFDSGFDLSGWGVAEWGTVAFGVYVLAKVFGDAKRVGTKVRKVSRGVKAKRRKQLQAQMDALR